MAIGIWSILIIVIAFQGLFLLAVLLLSKEKRAKAGNAYLALMVAVLIWFLAEFFMVRNKIDVGLSVFYGTRYGSWFLFGPLTYFYFRSITNAQWKFRAKDLLHFLPFLIFVIIIPLIAYKALNDRQVDYGMLSAFDHREKTLTTIQWMYSVVFILQFVHLGYFLLRNLKLIQKYTRRLQGQYSTIEVGTRWLRNFNIALIVILVGSAAFLYILLITDIYRRHLDYIYVVPIGLLFYFISFRLMKTEWKPVENGSKYAGSSLQDEQVPELVARLDRLMKIEKVYLDPIRLNDLAQRMDLRTHHVSQLINQQYNLSFYDFINYYRVQEAKELIANDANSTLMQISFDAGFNNKTSFVNAFKKFEQTTPSRYRDSLSRS